MPLFYVALLAAVQGITEFLPISSHGHLILARAAFSIETAEQGLLTDIAVHVGALAAVILYFRRDVWQILVGLARLATGRGGPQARLVLLIAVATPPVIVAGYLLTRVAADGLAALTVIGWATLGFALLLYAADRWGMTLRRIEHMKYGTAAIIGLFQILALIPGTSRSGITMTAARLLGYERVEAARFSLLLSIPTILAAGLWLGFEVQARGDLALQSDLLLAAALAFVAALLSIAAMMRWLARATFTPFVVYRILLGGALLAWSYGWIGA